AVTRLCRAALSPVASPRTTANRGRRGVSSSHSGRRSRWSAGAGAGGVDATNRRTTRVRTWLIAFALAITTIVLSSAPAFAQTRPREDIDVERFKPALTADGFVAAEGSAVRPTEDRWQAGLFLNYALNPLVVVDQTSSIRDRIVAGR